MNINKQSGFTLAEVLIVLACSAIVGTILVTILVQGSSIFNDQNTRVNQNLSLNSINSKITQPIQ
jgi:prepilin-type N-terminal cleavage/methylation domain-containing protein